MPVGRTQVTGSFDGFAQTLGKKNVRLFPVFENWEVSYKNPDIQLLLTNQKIWQATGKG